MHERPTHFVREGEAITLVWPDDYPDAEALPDGFWLDHDGACIEALTWDGAAFVERVDFWRARRWAEIKRDRDAAIAAGVATPIGPVDSDEVSIARIDRLARQAERDPEWTDEFSPADNVAVPVDAATMVAIDAAVAAHVSACRARAVALRAELQAAATLSEIMTVERYACA